MLELVQSERWLPLASSAYTNTDGSLGAARLADTGSLRRGGRSGGFTEHNSGRQKGKENKEQWVHSLANSVCTGTTLEPVQLRL